MIEYMVEYMSPEGLEKLKKELDYLKNTKRKEIVESLQKAIDFGDLSENAEYLEAKETQSFVEGRILELETLLKEAVIVSKKRQGDSAQIGSTVLVSLDSPQKSDNEKFEIVGAEEANPLEGKISADSPFGKAVLSKRKGNIIQVETPRGRVYYKILEIE